MPDFKGKEDPSLGQGVDHKPENRIKASEGPFHA